MITVESDSKIKVTLSNAESKESTAIFSINGKELLNYTIGANCHSVFDFTCFKGDVITYEGVTADTSYETIEFTTEQYKLNIENAVDKLVAEKLKQFNYISIGEIGTIASTENQWTNEAINISKWYVSVYEYFYNYEFIDTTLPAQDFLNKLPKLEI